MPCSLLPIACVFTQLLEVDRSIEVGCKELIMDAGIGTKNIDGVYAIEVVVAHFGAEHIHYPGIKANGQNCGQSLLPKLLAQCQFMVVPGRGYIEVAGQFEYSCIQVMCANFQAGAHHADMGIGCCDIDDDSWIDLQEPFYQRVCLPGVANMAQRSHSI